MPLIYPDANDLSGIIKRSPEPSRSPAPHVADRDIGELHHDEEKVRQSQRRAARNPGVAWTRRRNGFRPARPL
jgi:hypothetical protein